MSELVPATDTQLTIAVDRDLSDLFRDIEVNPDQIATIMRDMGFSDDEIDATRIEISGKMPKLITDKTKSYTDTLGDYNPRNQVIRLYARAIARDTPSYMGDTLLSRSQLRRWNVASDDLSGNMTDILVHELGHRKVHLHGDTEEIDRAVTSVTRRNRFIGAAAATGVYISQLGANIMLGGSLDQRFALISVGFSAVSGLAAQSGHLVLSHRRAEEEYCRQLEEYTYENPIRAVPYL